MDMAQTTAQAAASVVAAAKKRKVNLCGESYVELKKPRVSCSASKTEEESSVPEADEYVSTSDHVETSSCCSSNGCSSELVQDGNVKFVDLEDESDLLESWTYSSSSRERREMTAPKSELQAEEESHEVESTVRSTEAAEPRRRSPKNMAVVEAELEEFFAAAEKDIQKQFLEKYNYDIVKDEPVEGRYEWVRLNP